MSPRYSTTPLALTPKASMPLAAPVLMADKEAIAVKLMHAFPWNATAQVGMQPADTTHAYIFRCEHAC
jgi:hypothetical protein